SDRFLREPLGGLLGLDIRNESVFVLIDVDPTNGIDRLLNGRQSSLHPQRCQAPQVEFRWAHPARMWPGATCFSTRRHLFANKSKLASSVCHPKLMRIAVFAVSGGTPIAASTWLGATLPDEQADPEDTETPSRSSAITSVSAGTPSIPIHRV